MVLKEDSCMNRWVLYKIFINVQEYQEMLLIWRIIHNLIESFLVLRSTKSSVSIVFSPVHIRNMSSIYLA